MEPEWIEHDGSAVCPVPAGHDVEVRFRDGATGRNHNPEGWGWLDERFLRDITHYRDWTAFEQQREAFRANFADEQQQAKAGEVPENPAAFPLATANYIYANGMTLRDWFAGQALAGMGTWMPALSSASLVTPSGLLDRAEWAYEQADAMLRARGVTLDPTRGEGGFQHVGSFTPQPFTED